MTETANKCPICGMKYAPYANLVTHLIHYHWMLARDLCFLFDYVKDWNTFMSYLRVAKKESDDKQETVFFYPPAIDKSK